MEEIIKNHGPESIIPYSYLGNQGLVHGLNGGDAFLIKWGPPFVKEHFAAKVHAQHGWSTIGPTAGLDRSYIHSKYIVIWACNSIGTNLHHWAIVQDAKKNGAKVVVIDFISQELLNRLIGILNQNRVPMELCNGTNKLHNL